MSRAALQVVISDLFHLRLGASWGVISNHSYSLKVFIVFVALGVPFPQVHLWGGGGGGGGGRGNTSCGISTGPASEYNYTLLHACCCSPSTFSFFYKFTSCMLPSLCQSLPEFISADL